VAFYSAIAPVFSSVVKVFGDYYNNTVCAVKHGWSEEKSFLKPII
jgi:hypothetical protein